MLVNDTIDGLQDLLGLLTSVNDKGWDSGYRESISRGRERSGNPHSYTEPLLSLRQALDHAKGAMAALSGVKQHLAKEIRSLQRRCTPLVLEDGIKRLPDELLAHIFKMGHDIADGCEFSLAVSHVSCRFRQVSIGTPRLWTRLSIIYRDDQIREFITHSCDLGLEVSDDLRFEGNTAQPFLELLGPLSSRWSSLDISSSLTEDMMQSLGITSFPRLRHIEYFSMFSPMTDISSWYLPSLSSIGTQGLPFTELERVALHARLTYIDLCLHMTRVDVTALSRALNGLKTLRDLSLTLSNCEETAEADRMDQIQTRERHSVNINTLTLAIRESPTKSLVEGIYNALSIYTPTEVHLSITTKVNYGSYNLSSQGKFFPYGCTIRIHFYPCTGGSNFYCGIPDILNEIVEHCDIARSVLLDFPSSDDGMDQLTCISPIRHLHLRNCDKLGERGVDELARTLLSAEEDKGLESLEIITCKGISEDFLLNLQDEVGPGLTWVM
ncbi:hypothetical protein BD410DRAFT_829169 [Rickenella mellea]|uniref:Uncharacterized protein n=1 Tax=Rickenella mellea TaxID=50990 RepID=A0A4Y7Q1Q4_9AGAM|nr:hypothetical protein BD410DRAFT_829169 [Rickenella mellea]